MKKILLFIIGISFANIVSSQEMPYVFNKSLAGNDNQLVKVETYEGDLMVIGGGLGRSYFAKISTDGKILFEKKENNKDAAIYYNDMLLTEDGSVLIVGGGSKFNGAGRISLFNNKGDIIFDKVFANKETGKNSGGYFTKVKQDHLGNFIAVGVDGSSPSRARMTKLNNKGEILFDKVFKESTIFNDLLIDEEDSLIGIGGDIGDSRGHGILIKLNSIGDKVYEISTGNGGFCYTDGALMADGSIIAIGGGAYGTGNPCRVSKVREDGQIVFSNTYSVVDGQCSSMFIDDQGQILLSTKEFDRGRILKLRPDGTIIFNKEIPSPVVELKVNSIDQIVAIGSKDDLSELIKLSSNGKIIFKIPAPGVPLKNLLLSEDGKIYTSSAKSCRILKFDGKNGDLLFDKEYGKIDAKASYNAIKNLPSGEIIAIGGGKEDGHRITKISHGASINDISVQEPINGSIIARVTVSLTGFLLQDGVRKPVTISYKTVFNNKVDKDDVTPIDGVLSFVPSDFSQGETIVKTIELPINSDQFLEGTEKVSIELSEAKNIYISKATGIVTIEDSEGVIRFISGSDAVEGKPLSYTIGLFKLDGTVVTNKTGTPIKIGYKFGFGSGVPNVDFNASTKKPLIINNGESTGNLTVKTIEDNFYKDAQSVQLVLTEISYSQSSIVEFFGKARTLSLIQYIKDMGAEVQISKISDHNRAGENVTSMFKISLVKASNGATLTNCSGGDIKIQFAIDSTSTAIANKDFVIMNSEGVSILGGCGGREADIKVICIPDKTAISNSSIVLNIAKVAGPASGGPLNISSKKRATALLLASGGK